MNQITLSVAEIKDLARFAGWDVTGDFTVEDGEAEITIAKCPPAGVHDEDRDYHTRFIAYYDEYPEEGVFPLGV